ncbi:hypothetical protein NLI96_g2471 [Meripilus lineatus]|uniref:PARP-type domain-containing protein n=1 Tax=Meripilus lineatus TaxID=2056292 RepID=A0AAD5V8J3_9APHY|nr:hypothetical protein NLI96_g2471 [Physisporinus lineatus]
MAATHIVEYSKSSRAACHGAPPCKGSLIDIGTLRYGAVGHGKYGETVEWRHWGCVTPEILGRLAFAPVDNVPGFNELKQEDQRKIRLAIGLRRVDASDIPDTARVGSRGDENAAPGPSQAKRKAAFEIAMAQAQGPRRASQPSSSQKPSSSQGPRLLSAPTASQIAAEVEEEIPVQEEIIDELLCNYNTNVVGIQYYNGLVGDDEEVRLVRQPQNQYDRNAIKVENIGRAQVGHIPKQVAARLAPLMDRNQITVEGVVNQGNLRGRQEYTLPMYATFPHLVLVEPD